MPASIATVRQAAQTRKIGGFGQNSGEETRLAAPRAKLR